jgi:2-oxoglutarate dehydrogenase complex dehydrogenase (E1) component-like enzyme
MLLNGNDVMDPDYSSTRISCFPSLAANTNVCIAYSSTAAQYFHLLSETDLLPLIVFAPKGLLRPAGYLVRCSACRS